MVDSLKVESGFRRLSRLRLFLVVGFTAIIGVSLFFNLFLVNQNVLEASRIQGRVAIQKDVIYRRWNAEMGGVYVPVTEKTRPNPYLNVSERDIFTSSNRALTLMNPAYMTRKVHELGFEVYGEIGHITSLKPVRPENAADSWETDALLAFEEGESEVSSVVKIDGLDYMRLMRPLITDETCLKCHAFQGYKVGDIRGGISVAVPMERMREISRKQVFTMSAGHFFVWLFGFIGIVLLMDWLMKSEEERVSAEEQLVSYSKDLEHSNMLKDLFIDIMRHDLLNPVSVARNLSKFVLKEEVDPKKREALEIVVETNEKVIGLIEDASVLAKLESVEKLDLEELDLGIELRSVVNELNHLADDRGTKIILNVEGEYLVLTSPLVHSVFSNLIGNAIKYGSSDSEIVIEIQDDGSDWKISVADHGGGVPDKYKEQIFNRFKRIRKGAVKGSGLGLAIVKQVVDAHSGRVWVEDNPGGGSIFFVTLPKK